MYTFLYTPFSCKSIFSLYIWSLTLNYKLMRKTLLFLAVLIGQFVTAKDNIDLVMDSPGLDPEDDPRSVTQVMASIDGQVVTVSFSELTESQIVVTDSAELTVYNQIYAPACSVQVNLNSLPSGSYTLHIYAFGVWWYGLFTLQ